MSKKSTVLVRYAVVVRHEENPTQWRSKNGWGPRREAYPFKSLDDARRAADYLVLHGTDDCPPGQFGVCQLENVQSWEVTVTDREAASSAVSNLVDEGADLEFEGAEYDFKFYA